MFLGSRTLLRLGRTSPALNMVMARARFSTAANDEYHSLDG